MQISTLLRLKHCLRPHIESTSCNKFKRRFSHFLATFRATIGSVLQQILRAVVDSERIQDGDEENSAVQQKLRANIRTILRLCWTALKTNRCKKMRICNTML